MEETKVALIPRVMVPSATGAKEYGLLLTDRQSVFVLEKSPKVLAGALLGGAVGAVIANAAATKKVVDYQNEDPSLLATQKGNVGIPHGSIESLGLRWRMGGYRLTVRHVRGDGSRKKLEAIVVPPDDYVKMKKRQGVKRKEALAIYARDLREAYLRALPPEVTRRARWQL